jgi:hypothetical protein
MRYHLTLINTRPWLLNGLSLRLIESHYENHYGGALRRLNAITEQLETLDFVRSGAIPSASTTGSVSCRSRSRWSSSAPTDSTWDARRRSRCARRGSTRST